MRPALIVENGVYVDASLTNWRRVIQVVDDHAERYVVYSLGTDLNRWCLLRTFARWARKQILVDDEGIITEVEHDIAAGEGREGCAEECAEQDGNAARVAHGG